MHLKHCSEKGFVSVPALPEGSVCDGREVKSCLPAAGKPLSVSLEGAPVPELGSSGLSGLPLGKVILKYKQIDDLWGHFWNLACKKPNVI